MDAGFGPIPEELKHLPRISPTGLAELAEAPSFYQAYLERKKKTTKTMEEGTIIHQACLEPETFFETYARGPLKEEFPDALFTADDLKAELEFFGLKKSGNKQELIDRLKAHCAEKGFPAPQIFDDIVADVCAGKIELGAELWQACIKLAEKVKARKFCSKVWERATKEVQAWALMDFTDDDGQVHQYILNGYGDFVVMDMEIQGQKLHLCGDIKKVQSVKPRKFRYEVRDNLYHLKAFMYITMLARATKTDPAFWRFIWVGVVKNPPYPVQEFAANFGMIEGGNMIFDALIKRWFKCRKANHWPDYSEDVINLDLPHTEFDAIEAEFGNNEI